jgi:hypothetical protein
MIHRHDGTPPVDAAEQLKTAKVQAMSAALGPASEHVPGSGWAHTWAHSLKPALG